MSLYFIKCFLCPQVAKNEADLGVGPFACTHARSTMVDCSHALKHSFLHWFTRPPRPLPPATNILRIYSAACWFMIFITIVCVSVFLVLAAKMGSYYDVTNENYQHFLIPYR